MIFNKKNKRHKRDTTPQEFRAPPLPKEKQVFGFVEQRLGGSRMRVRCFDGKTRVCRIPGRLKRSLWVRETNIVIVQPWELSGETKGDVILKYLPNQVNWLKRNGYLDKLEELEEF